MAFMLIILLGSWDIPVVPQDFCLCLLLSHPPKKQELSAPCVNLPFRPVFLKPLELHIDAINPNVAIQIFASRPMVYSQLQKLTKAMTSSV